MRASLTLAAFLLSTSTLAAPHVQGPNACQGNCPNWHTGDVGDDPIDGGHLNISVNVDAVARATSEARSEAISTAEGGLSSAEGSTSYAQGGVVGDVAATTGNVVNSVNFEPAASTAYAAALTASAGTCMGSTSVGGQGVSFGISVGSTWSDPDCNIRRYSAILQSFGETEAAIQLLCLNKEVRSVLARCRSPLP